AAEGNEEGHTRAFRLELTGGTLDSLSLRGFERRPPGRGEVEIEVRAAGLNFSDVLKALGLYPGLPEGLVPLGLECSGVVSRAGEGVTGLGPGDPVIAFAPFSFASHVTIPAGLVAPMPPGIPFEDAATIPVAFLTAYHALFHQGRLAAGESVLIHSASGGVGL